MLTYRTTLKGRTGRNIKPTPEEAAEMQSLGFRFSIYLPASGELQLSLPASLIIIAQQDELIFEQP